MQYTCFSTNKIPTLALDRVTEQNRCYQSSSLRLVRAFLLSCICLFPAALYAQQHSDGLTINSKPPAETIKVGYVDFAPYEFLNEKQEADGIFINIIRKITQEAGFQAEFFHLPISRLYLYLKEGKIDVWPGLKSVPALQGYVLESQSSPMTINLCLFYTNPNLKFSGFESLTKEKLILVNGYTYGGLLYKLTDKSAGYDVSFTPGSRSGLQMLAKGRGDFFLDYLEPISIELKKKSMPNLSYHVIKQRDGAFVVSQKAPNAERIMAELERAYHELVVRGDIVPHGQDLRTNSGEQP